MQVHTHTNIGPAKHYINTIKRIVTNNFPIFNFFFIPSMKDGFCPQAIKEDFFVFVSLWQIVHQQ